MKYYYALGWGRYDFLFNNIQREYSSVILWSHSSLWIEIYLAGMELLALYPFSGL